MDQDHVSETQNNRGQRRTKMRLQQICEVASKLFVIHGYQATSLDMIAEAMGYARPSLYHYVKNKEEVLAILAEAFLSNLYEKVTKYTDGDYPSDVRLQRLIYSSIAAFCEYPEIKVLSDMSPSKMIAQWKTNFPLISDLNHQYIEYVRSVIQQGVDDSTFKVKNVKHSASTLLAGLNMIARRYNPEWGLNPDQLAEQMSEVFIGGFMNPWIAGRELDA